MHRTCNRKSLPGGDRCGLAPRGFRGSSSLAACMFVDSDQSTRYGVLPIRDGDDADAFLMFVKFQNPSR